MGKQSCTKRHFTCEVRAVTKVNSLLQSLEVLYPLNSTPGVIIYSKLFNITTNSNVTFVFFNFFYFRQTISVWERIVKRTTGYPSRFRMTILQTKKLYFKRQTWIITYLIRLTNDFINFMKTIDDLLNFKLVEQSERIETQWRRFISVLISH